MRHLSAALFPLLSLTACDVPPEGAAPAGWSAHVEAQVLTEAYAPTADPEGFRVLNAAHGLRGRFHHAGVSIAGLGASAEDIELALVAWGRPGALVAAAEVAPVAGPCVDVAQDTRSACAPRIDYVRTGLTEWWVNAPAGLEQGFTLAARPPGEGPLVLDVAVRGAAVEVREDAAELRVGDTSFRYAGLAAWDARGSVLPARLEATDDGVRIVVDDEGAVGAITVDPLLTAPTWTVESDVAQARFGVSVASAGDVNGDGFGDVIVGAQSFPITGANDGKAFLYLGSPSGLSTTAAWSGSGGAPGALFGHVVASAGDVNGDGYADVVIGAPLHGSGQLNEGGAWLFLGNATGLDATASWSRESQQVNAYYGVSVASAGDVNADGYSDVIVGASQYDNGESDEGRAFVYLGSAAGLQTTASWTYEANAADAELGASVAGAGDVNGDGFADVVVGAERYTGSLAAEGRAYVFYGSQAGLAGTPAWTSVGGQAGAQLGTSVAGAGDVNGDGFADLIVGASAFTNGQSGEGKAFVFLGSVSGPASTPVWGVEGGQVGGGFGHQVATAGDVNGDGYADVVVAAPNEDAGGQTDEGRVRLFLGAATGPRTTAVWSFESDQVEARMSAAAAAGDVNGDGYGDVILGTSSWSDGQTNEGRAALFLGSGSGLASAATASLTTDLAGDELGHATSAGDVNGDGFDDVIVGMSEVGGTLVRGQAVLYFGSSSGLDPTVGWSVSGTRDGARLGASVASAGDVNADGYADVVIGAPNETNGQTAEGRVYVYLGSPTGLAASPARVLESNQADARFGSSVASAGDVDGDGFDDVIIGAPLHDGGGSNEGRAYVYFGGPAGISTRAPWTADGGQTDSSWGTAVASAGDVNADGYADVVIGSSRFDGALTNQGRVALFRGMPGGLEAASVWSVTADRASSNFGGAVASAGDVNGDGRSDIVVGARAYAAPQSDEGRAYVFLGDGAALAATPVWTYESDKAGAQLGASVAAAGDVNGDGFGDIVVGASDWTNAQAAEGRALMFLGSPSGRLASPSWTFESNQAAAYLGRFVAGAGDVNDDGFADVVVGAPGYDDGQTDEGRVWLFLGNAQDGAGLGVRRSAVARRAGTLKAISPGLIFPGDSFDVHLANVRTVWGRSRVRVQVEVKELGAAFDAQGLRTGGSIALSTGALPVTLPITGLTSRVGYHWRARVLYAPAQAHAQGWGPWTYGGTSGEAAGGHLFAELVTLFPDADGDGFGATDTPLTTRTPAVGVVVVDGTDCDDAFAHVHPGGSEVCDPLDLDEDCDGLIDDADNAPGPLSRFYRDADGDGFGTRNQAVLQCDPSPGFVVDDTDCNDSAPTAHPGASEVCDPVDVDEDCDGLADDGDPSVDASTRATFWVDGDGDGFGGQTSVQTCQAQAGTVANAADCDDGRAWVSPAGVELCDAANLDENCDGRADDADPTAGGRTTFYVDGDGDSFGGATPAERCDVAAGFAATSTDCDDAASQIHPGGVEVCDALDADEDCDGQRDDADPSVASASRATFYVDGDGDGYGGTTPAPRCDVTPGFSATADDCDDAASLTHPGGTERCDPLDADEDCDGASDDADTTGASPVGRVTRWRDEDGDGHGGGSASLRCDLVEGFAETSTDCDDTPGSGVGVHPGAQELCDDADVDEDCDALADDADPSVSAASMRTLWVDADADGFGGPTSTQRCDVAPGVVETSTDCADDAPAAHPGGMEVCDAADLDEDCSGVSDDADAGVSAASLRTFWIDGDGDGAGGPTATHRCDRIDGLTETSTDCDDARADVHPLAPEVCDARNVDEDCDAVADDLDPSVSDSGRRTLFVDADDDGYGGADTERRCDLATGLSVIGGDCDDALAAVNPGAGAREVPNDGVDQDCDGFDPVLDTDGGGETDTDDTGAGSDTDVVDSDTDVVDSDTDVADTDARETDTAVSVDDVGGDTAETDTDRVDTDVVDSDVHTDRAETDPPDTDPVPSDDEVATDDAEAVGCGCATGAPSRAGWAVLVAFIAVCLRRRA